MIFLSETKMKNHRIDGVRRRMGFLNGFSVSPLGKAGGMSLWWVDSLEVDQGWVRITGVDQGWVRITLLQEYY